MSPNHPIDYVFPEPEKEPIKPTRRGDERRKVRWVTSREGRSKYTPHQGTKELAKLIQRDPESQDLYAQ